jgi:hypothetical protein
MFPRQAWLSMGTNKSIALSHRFAMTKAGIIFLDMTPIGRYVFKTDKVCCLAHFAGIMKDYLQHTSTTVEVRNEQ